jgi:hypothetical protein
MVWLIYWKFFHDYWNRLLIIRQLFNPFDIMAPTNLVPDLCSGSSTSVYDRSKYSFDDKQQHKRLWPQKCQLYNSFKWMLSGCSNKSIKNLYDHQLVPSRGYQRFPMSVVTFLKKLQQSAEKTYLLCLLLRPANPSLVGPLRASPLEGEWR